MQLAATLPGGMPGTCYAACCMEGKVLLGSHSGQLKQWDVAASAPVALPDLEGHTDVVYSVKVSTSMVLSGSMDETMRLWDQQVCAHDGGAFGCCGFSGHG